MNFKAKMHVRCGSGARMAELAGAEDSEIRRLGRWNAQALAGCYLAAIPRAAVRTLAGFSPEAGSYFLKRAAVVPSYSLQSLVFPWLNSYLDPSVEMERTIAVQGFVSLLQYLIVVVLQDAAIVSRKYPSHPLFQLSLFRSEQFLTFRRELEEAMSAEEDPTESNLHRFLPALTDKINNAHQSLMAKSNMIQQEVQSLTQHAVESNQKINDVLSGKAPLF
jgi:hypothetical protein